MFGEHGWAATAQPGLGPPPRRTRILKLICRAHIDSLLQGEDGHEEGDEQVQAGGAGRPAARAQGLRQQVRISQVVHLSRVTHDAASHRHCPEIAPLDTLMGTASDQVGRRQRLVVAVPI